MSEIYIFKVFEIYKNADMTGRVLTRIGTLGCSCHCSPEVPPPSTNGKETTLDELIDIFVANISMNNYSGVKYLMSVNAEDTPTNLISAKPRNF